MTDIEFPLLIEPSQLQPMLGSPNLLVVDLCRPQQYSNAHIPGAVYLPFAQLMSGQAPAPGKLPPEQQISQALSAIGLTPETHVVAYDDEGGGWAGRLLWTLEIIGHSSYSYLNGGLHAWANEQRPLEDNITAPTPSQYEAHYQAGQGVSKEDIVAELAQPQSDFIIWDARSQEEYQRHIPGAVNYEWIRAMNQHNGLRIRDHNEIRAELAALGITPDKQIITHCQSHHRSSFTWMLGKILGFTNIQAYPGSWAEWDSDPNTPVETQQP